MKQRKQPTPAQLRSIAIRLAIAKTPAEIRAAQKEYFEIYGSPTAKETQRRKILDKLFDQVSAAGLDETSAVYTGERQAEKWPIVRGTARVFERDGELFLRFPKSLITLFDLRAGDKVRFRKRRGKVQYLVTFWRHGKPLRPKSSRK